MKIETISDFRAATRHGPFAWPGGYPCYFILSDGEALSFDSAKANRRAMLESIVHRHGDGWRPVALDVNWEDGELTCSHSGKRIQSAYAEPDETNATESSS